MGVGEGGGVIVDACQSRVFKTSWRFGEGQVQKESSFEGLFEA